MRTLPAVGATIPNTGMITTLNALMPGAEEATEEQLGFHRGRLAAGYALLVLRDTLTPGDFQFAGTTMRSDGRLGLPHPSSKTDKGRVEVHSTIMLERGPEGYRDFQKFVLRDIPYSGERRLARIIPAIEHDAKLPPDFQYPMGGGALQWRVIQPKDFFVALVVDANGTATTPGFTVPLHTGAHWDDLAARTRLRQYLERC